MELTGLWGAFYRVSLIISKLAYVNVLWILFSLAGLILLGVAPATVALFSVTRAWARKEWDIPVFQTFWSVYKQEFWKASGSSAILFGVGFLLYWNFTLFAGGGATELVIRGILLIVTVFFAGMLLLYFPTYVSFRLNGFGRVRAALLLACGHPYHLVCMVVGLYLLQFIFMFIPGLLLFFAVASAAYLLSWLSEKIFASIKKKHELQQEVTS
ncbi:putative membrane protein YesL [Alkalihalobacillus xiaoxiensis]|uniref:Membrane protein YesL n=1 Tax=Shouchella xiaoxiensis TaxID=766895 RepID=A0ABS2STW5_9BACI|nr:putative membrane protein YesL [Shouchella xiaoxiensis]